MCSDAGSSGLLVTPFRALRYADGTRLGARICPPYDVINDTDRDLLEASDRHNAVRLILPRGDEHARYQRARKTLADWQRDGVLRREPEPAMYVYQMVDAGRVTRGLIAAVALRDPADAVILPHENTMAGPVADRLALMRATEADLEAIYLVADAGDVFAAILDDAVARPPIARATAPDGVTHTLWALTDADTQRSLADSLRPRSALIADGHHRYATYREYQRIRRRSDGPGPWDSGLAFLSDANRYGPGVQAIHRVVPSMPLTEAVRRAAGDFTVRELPGQAAALAELADAAGGAHAFVLSDSARWVLLRRDRADGDSLGKLDVSVAHRELIATLWGLPDDERTVGYAHDVADAVSRAAASGGTALLLNPTPPDQVAAVAAAAQRMPRKSTLFTPKPATGMLFRLLS